MSILSFDKACADAAIQVSQSLNKKGKNIDFADLCIGATALAHNLSIATLNIKHFSMIEGLRVI